jgi:toxin CcdB
LRQFDIYSNPSERSRAAAPFVVVLQSHLLNAMPTVVVAPVLIDDSKTAYTEASVSVVLNGSGYVISVAELAAIDARHLHKVVGDLREHEDALRRALDRVFTGF